MTNFRMTNLLIYDVSRLESWSSVFGNWCLGFDYSDTLSKLTHSLLKIKQ